MTTEQLFINFVATPPNLDPSIDWVPMSVAQVLLRRHPSQIRRDRAVLKRLELVDHVGKSSGFSRQTFNALWVFRQLVQQRGRREAIKVISNYLEEQQ